MAGSPRTACTLARPYGGESVSDDARRARGGAPGQRSDQQSAKESARALSTLPHAARSAAPFGAALDHLPPALGSRRSLPRSVSGLNRCSSGPGIDEGAASFRPLPSARDAVKITEKNGCDRFSATGRKCRARQPPQPRGVPGPVKKRGENRRGKESASSRAGPGCPACISARRRWNSCRRGLRRLVEYPVPWSAGQARAGDDRSRGDHSSAEAIGTAVLKTSSCT